MAFYSVTIVEMTTIFFYYFVCSVEFVIEIRLNDDLTTYECANTQDY